MVAAQTLVWTAVKPILKLTIMFAVGALFARRKILVPSGSKLISSLLIYLFYPCLLFATSSTAIDENNIHLIGIILPFAAGYVLLGYLLGLVVRWCTRPVKNFRNGIVMAVAMGNMGDLPIAIISSLGDSAPFNEGDSAFGIALVSCFCLIPNLFFFTVGYQSIQADFLSHELHRDQHRNQASHVLNSDKNETPNAHDSSESVLEMTSIRNSQSIHEPTPVHSKCNDIFSTIDMYLQAHPQLLRAWRAVIIPTNLAAFFGIIVACVPALKGLFISTSDHTAPLAIFLEVTQFIGAAAIPLAVVVLGANIGGLETSRFPPLKYSMGVSLAKLIIMPIICISIVQGFRHLGWITGPSMLVFVLMLESCVPSANTCMFLSLMSSPDGKAENLAGVMLIEYALSFLTITGTLVTIFALL